MVSATSSPRWFELRRLGRLALPLCIISSGTQLMSVVDAAVVGRLGAVPLGAVGLGNGLFFSLSVLGMGTMMGLDPLISQALGAGEPQRARMLLWQGIWLSFPVAAVLSLLLLFSPLLLRLFDIPAELAGVAKSYLFIRLVGLAPLLLQVAMRNYLQALGRPAPLVWATVVGNVFNLVADVVLVFGGRALPAWAGPLRAVPALGVSGAALATVCCTVLQVGMVALAIRGIRVEGFTWRQRRTSVRELRRAVEVGVPVGLQMALETGVFALAGLLAGRLGAQALAAHQIALQLASLSFTVALGLGSAGSVRVGLHVGARDHVRARQAGLTAFGAAGGFMGLAAVAFLFFPRALAMLLTNQQEVIEATLPVLAVVAAFQMSDGFQAVGAGVLRGAGDTRFAFLANLAGHYLLGLPVAVGLGVALKLGVVGLWCGLAVGLTAVATALFTRFLKVSGRPIRALEDT